MNPVDILAPIDARSENGRLLDLAYGFIDALLPIGQGSPYGMAFAVVTSTLVFFGAIFLAWHILVGVVASAYSGKVLGERWHQIWAPLRVVAGFGMLIPVVDGYSTAHILLKDVVAVAAINVGNATVSMFIEGMSDENMNPTAVVATGGLAVAKAFAEREICAAVRDGSSHGQRRSELPPVQSSQFETGGFLGFGTTSMVGWNYGSCGTVTWSDTENSAEFMASRNAATATLVESIRAVADPLGNAFRSARRLADADEATILSVFEGAGIEEAQFQDVIQAIYGYNAAVSAASQVQIANENPDNDATMKGYIDTHGFMAAGTYWRAISSRTASITALANNVPDVSATSVREEIAVKTSAALMMFNDALSAQTSVQNADWRTMQTFGRDTTADSIMTSVSASIADFTWISSADAVDPVQEMITMGHRLLWLVTIYIAAMVGVSAFAAGVGGSVAGWAGGGALEGGVAYLLQWVDFLMTFVMLAGMVNAYVLPMIPFIMVFMMGLGWLVLFLEASIAVILWAFSFIRMDGTDFIGDHQKQGAALLFNLLLRPCLGMLAFVGSFYILPVALNALSTLWMLGFYGSQGGHWVGLFGMVASMILYSYMQWQICLRIFGMIPTITDRVTKWSGLGDGSGYNEASETDRMNTAFVGAAAMGRGAPLKAATRSKSLSDASDEEVKEESKRRKL